jgi:hypothetical protein
MIDCFQVEGRIPEEKDVRKRMLNGTDSSEAHSLRILG